MFHKRIRLLKLHTRDAHGVTKFAAEVRDIIPVHQQVLLNCDLLPISLSKTLCYELKLLHLLLHLSWLCCFLAFFSQEMSTFGNIPLWKTFQSCITQLMVEH